VIVPVTWRAASFVASANRNDTLSWPLNPAAGVTVMVWPEAVARPLPSATVGSPTMVKGLPSAANGSVT